MTFKIGNKPQIDIIINDEGFEIIFEKNKPENIFLYRDLKKVRLKKGKRFLLISLLSWIIEILSDIFIEKVYRNSDELLIFKNGNNIIKKELISEKINFANLELAIQSINQNIKRTSSMNLMAAPPVELRGGT